MLAIFHAKQIFSYCSAIFVLLHKGSHHICYLLNIDVDEHILILVLFVFFCGVCSSVRHCAAAYISMPQYAVGCSTTQQYYHLLLGLYARILSVVVIFVPTASVEVV